MTGKETVTVTPIIRPGAAEPVICRPVVRPVGVWIVAVGITTRVPGISVADWQADPDKDSGVGR